MIESFYYVCCPYNKLRNRAQDTQEATTIPAAIAISSLIKVENAATRDLMGRDLLGHI